VQFLALHSIPPDLLADGPATREQLGDFVVAPGAAVGCGVLCLLEPT
jgi:hypothetical protein